jgi:hypothetical protein
MVQDVAHSPSQCGTLRLKGQVQGPEERHKLVAPPKVWCLSRAHLMEAFDLILDLLG